MPKLLTMTGTGMAMVSTPAKAQRAPTSIPDHVSGRRIGRVGADALGVVDHGCKDEDAQRQEDDEQQELVGTRPQSVAQDPQANEVAGQLEDTQDADEAHHAQEAQRVFGCFGGEAAQRHLQVKGHDGHEVYDVEGAAEELCFVGAEDDARHHLNGEPDDADALHICQPAIGDYLVDDLRDGVEGFVGLQAEGGNGEEDEEERAERHILQRETERGEGVGCLDVCGGVLPRRSSPTSSFLATVQMLSRLDADRIHNSPSTAAPGGAALAPGGGALAPGGAALAPGGAALAPGGAALAGKSPLTSL
ncbi:hypothetical protein EYF80_051521 [Liparis tanakae]|uniref:Uncharacterized protein n=1 Tax=Liparis tanakae TaxID=230148 RepID=A0A4Z2FAW1_9TELE|nr:hypothetical protein EYF80_051521 [Liparis tanakae]